MSATSAAEVFAAMGKAVEVQGPSLIQQVAGTIQFDIKQGDGTTKSWTANLKDAPGAVTDGPVEGADLVVGMTEEDFLGMHDGTLDPQVAFMSGKILFVGDIALAFKLGTVIQSAQAQAAADEAAAAAAAAKEKGEEPPPLPPPPPPEEDTSCFLQCRVCCKLGAMQAQHKAEKAKARFKSKSPKAGGHSERTPLLSAASATSSSAPSTPKKLPAPPPPPPCNTPVRPKSNPQAGKKKAEKERRFSNEGMALGVEQPRMSPVAELQGEEEDGDGGRAAGAPSDPAATI